MEKKAILHIPMSEYAHAVTDKQVVIRLRCAKSDLVRCTLYYGDRACRENPIKLTVMPMRIVASDLEFDYFEVEFDTPYTRICYLFQLDDGKETVFYYGDLFCPEITPERSEYYQLPYVHRADIPKVPDWTKDAIIYNIFADSFATKHRYISKKNTEKQYMGLPVHGKLGGTIRGIMENADYLETLGINCIYINPIFTAGEYHKYDVLDYYSIDPCFGSNEDFAEMVEELHKRGIRVIIDGVFNHCSWKFFAFEDVVRNERNSRYADWFYRVEYPVVRPDNMEDIPGYECFAYERLMPKFNTANPEVIAYFCDVCRYWLREYKIDGWRLDVASEVNDEFWRAFRTAALAENPEAILIGEIWESAGHWLDGSMFNSTMNYDFRKHCREFFAFQSIDAAQFSGRVTHMLMRYRKSLVSSQLNLLDSHDVSRFISLCKGNIDAMKLAVLFQMCFVGMPSVFYGDEQGIAGLLEKEYRSPMQWSGGELYNFYQKAIQLRRDYIPLRRGKYQTKYAKDRLFVFCRQHEDMVITVAFNAGDKPVSYHQSGGKILWENNRFADGLGAYGFLITMTKEEKGNCNVCDN